MGSDPQGLTPTLTLMHLLGVDTGGTFTDFVLLTTRNNGQQQVRIHKVLSTPKAPEQAILQGINELGVMDSAKAGQLTVIHGSTVATRCGPTAGHVRGACQR